LDHKGTNDENLKVH